MITDDEGLVEVFVICKDATTSLDFMEGAGTMYETVLAAEEIVEEWYFTNGIDEVGLVPAMCLLDQEGYFSREAYETSMSSIGLDLTEDLDNLVLHKFVACLNSQYIAHPVAIRVLKRIMSQMTK